MAIPHFLIFTLIPLIHGALGFEPLPQVISSCLEAECPVSSISTSSECRVINETFPVIGIARIPTEGTSSLPRLTWVEGVSSIDTDKTRTFHKNFYLGRPPSLDLGNTGACALFLNNLSPDVKFPNQLDLARSKGTCEQALGKDCVDALTARAERLDVGGLSSVEACERLKVDLEESPIDPVCGRITATPGKWSGILARPLSGPQAAQPISAQENSTSNCWPIVPKSDSLTLVASIETKGDFLATTIQTTVFNIVPILTLFFPGNGSSSLVLRSESQLTCMKPIDLNVVTNRTMVGTDPNTGGSEAIHVSGGWIYLAVSLVTTLLVFFMAG